MTKDEVVDNLWDVLMAEPDNDIYYDKMLQSLIKSKIRATVTDAEECYRIFYG